MIARTLRHPMFLSFYAPSLLFALSLGIILPVMPLFAADFGVSYTVVGIAVAGSPLGMLLGDVPAGMLRRPLGNKGLMILGVVVIILSVLGIFLAQTILVVIVCRVFSGVGQALFNVSRHIVLADQVRIAKRGQAIAAFGGIARIGSALGPVVGGLVSSQFGQRMPFLLYIILTGLALLLIVIYMEPSEADFHGQKAEGPGLASVLNGNRNILFSAGAGQLFAQLIRAGRNIIIPLYGADVLGLSEAAIGLVMSVSFLFDVALFVPAGWIMDHLGRKFAIVPSFVFQSSAMLLVPLTTGFWGLMLIGSLIGFGNGISSGTMMTLGSDLAPPASRGEFLGVWRLIGDAGSMSGSFVVGWVASIFLLQTSAVAIAISGLGAAAIFAFRVPETLKK